MENLRWILLGAGIVLVIGIYFWESWRRRERNYFQGELDATDEELLHSLETERDAGQRDHLRDNFMDLAGLKGERMEDAPYDIGNIPSMLSETNQQAAEIGIKKGAIKDGEKRSPIVTVEKRPEAKGGECIIVLNVMADPGQNFSGSDIRAALEEVDMVFGDMQVFHHYGVGEMSATAPVFSTANLMEPGFFDLERMDELETLGLCFFLRLPGPLDGKVAFELMLNTGQRVAEKLGGDLRDETRGVITQQTLSHLRDRIAEFARKQLLSIE